MITQEGTSAASHRRALEDRGSSTSSPEHSEVTASRRPSAAILLTLLLSLNIVNYADRALIAVLAEPIRRELDLSDAQLGLLTGLSFAVVFSLAAFPIARVADRGLQRAVLTFSTLIWSIMTTLGGFATSFWQLAILRVGVALGEAGLHPSSHSLIALEVPADRRGRALSVFSLGLPVGIAVGATLAGWIADETSWRHAFFLIGPLGLLLVPAIWFLVPARSRPRNEVAQPAPLGEVATLLWRNPMLRRLALGYAASTTYGYSLSGFIGTFLIRDRGFAPVTAGSVIALVTGVLGAVGLMLGGLLYDEVARRWPARAMFPVVLALGLASVIAPIGYFASDWRLSIVMITFATLLYYFIIVPTVAAAQAVAPDNMKATASAMITMSGSLVGATVGPATCGVLSDLFTRLGVERGLSTALASLALLQLLGAAMYARAHVSGSSGA